MADNRGVAYMGPGKVELHDIDFPTFELKDGPGVNPANVGRKLPHAAITWTEDDCPSTRPGRPWLRASVCLFPAWSVP